MPTLDVTHWTDKTELFMEYPPLVTGRSALFAVHLTKLADFTPVQAGQTKIEFTPEAGGTPKVLVGPKPSRPGAFRVEDVPPAPGRYRWTLVLDAPGLSDRHDLGTITVFPDVQAARADAEKHATDDAAAIAYLKEQQWNNAFATARVVEAEVRHPFACRRRFIRSRAVKRLSRHQPPGGSRPMRCSRSALAFAQARFWAVWPRLSAGADRATLEADVAEARAVEAARVEQTRAEGLLAERAVPARRVEDARRTAAVAEALIARAEARLAQRDETLGTGGGAPQNTFALRAPIAGRTGGVMATWVLRTKRARLFPDRADGPRQAGSPGSFCRRGLTQGRRREWRSRFQASPSGSHSSHTTCSTPA
jgi:hypothetical protein